jgi:DNA-binding response OmpR family regulator
MSGNMPSPWNTGCHVRVLVVDDDQDIRETVSLCFEVRWPDAEVVPAEDGRSALRLFRETAPEIVILDLGLPDMDGLDVCHTIRKTSAVPILILTVRDQRGDIVRGLEMGADDYIVKPFDQMELLARANAILRRGSQQPATPATFDNGRISVDFEAREVRADGALVRLTPTEYALLEYLARNPGKPLTHGELLSNLWGKEYSGATDYLKVHILHLRRKLGDHSGTDALIATERGIGYKLKG